MVLNDDKDIYILGTISNNEITKVDSVSNILAKIDDDSENNTGNINCVNMPLIESGTTYIYRFTLDFTGESIDYKVVHDETSETHSKLTYQAVNNLAEPLANQSPVIEEIHYTINENVISITEQSKTIDNSVVIIKSSPTMKEMVNKFCVGDSLSYIINKTIDDDSANPTAHYVNFSIQSDSGIHIDSNREPSTSVTTSIVGVNEDITTPAGSFSTVKSTYDSTYCSDDNCNLIEEHRTTWRDQVTGIIVKSNLGLANIELISIQ